MSAESWPPQLKEWVASCLGQMSDVNREEAQAELRQVISDAYSSKTLWTTDWAGVQLTSLLPKPMPIVSNISLKRKFDSPAGQSKKAKKQAKQAAAAAAAAQFAATTATPPAPPGMDAVALSRRAERFRREHELERQKQNGSGAQAQALRGNQRTAHLFAQSSRSASPFGGADEPEADPNVPNWDQYTIVGTSQEIFKDYLRLTSDPKPELIRPYPVLQQTLTELKKRWREKVAYNWICSQFKSLRQDLTVQRIKNDFTVAVYEIHARMALEVADMVEYNQCQSSLKSLYELGIPGNVEEFTAYRILMLLHGRNRSELNLYVSQLTPKQKASPAVQHALAVQRALALGNYHALFEYYLSAPNMGAYIMDHFVERERIRALLIMTKAYPRVPLSLIHQELAFDSLAHVRDFLQANRAAHFVNPNSADADAVLDCKAVSAVLPAVLEEKYRKVQIKGAI
ncbi:SAC3/GANP/Nin1/mts3/eIF-3 p25 family-domain-containing protein [Gloeopeniophorella convolvens]|nr:SAC3/GANP/Nin1/mts3/eIF-3 p25 family-domain-containing protein [Gloeopeniophorella convolvens]